MLSPQRHRVHKVNEGGVCTTRPQRPQRNSRSREGRMGCPLVSIRFLVGLVVNHFYLFEDRVFGCRTNPSNFAKNGFLCALCVSVVKSAYSISDSWVSPRAARRPEVHGATSEGLVPALVPLPLKHRQCRRSQRVAHLRPCGYRFR